MISSHPLRAVGTRGALMLGVCGLVAGLGGCGGGGTAAGFSSPATVRFTVGSAANFHIAATGSGRKISESGALPGGLHLSQADGGRAVISGTPRAGTGGRYLVTLKAGPATQRLVLTVDEAPYFVSSGTVWGVAFKFDKSPIVAKGYPLPSISENGKLPRGMQFRSTGNGKAVIFGTPDPSLWGTIAGSVSGPTVTLIATNSVGSANQTMQLNITGGGN